MDIGRTAVISVKIAAAGSSSEVCDLFRAAIAAHGFNASACGCFHITRRGAVPEFYFQDWPEAWLRLYAAQNFVNHDYGVEEARSRSGPFTWSEAHARRRLTSGEARVWQAVLDFGWNDGFSVPVHGPGGYFGLVTMAGTARDLPIELRQHLYLISLAAHDRCKELAGDMAGSAPVERLTARELECFRWVAAGASDAAIGRSLGISANTAKEYIANGRQKLKAANRAQAVAILMAACVL